MFINGNFIYTKFKQIENHRATIIITHGLAEHTHRYDEFVETLNKNGYQTFQYDIQGHGRSQGKRGDVKSYTCFIDDLYQIVTFVKEHTEKPVIIFGHSLGGLISNLYASTHQNIDGLISSAAATDTPKNAKILKYIGFKLIRNIKIYSSVFANDLSRDPLISKNQESDPYSIKFFRVNLIGEMLVKGVKYLKKNRHQLNVPVIYLHSTDDKIVEEKFSDSMYENISSNDKSIKKYVNAKHELLNEINKDEVTNDILQWLNGRF